MISHNVKLIGGAVLGAVVLAGGTYAYATNAAKPELVTVAHQGCGTPTPVQFSLPLQALHEAAPMMAVTYDRAEPITAVTASLSFNPTVSGRESEVALVDGTLVLPLAFGRNDLAPTRIRINCRDGAITSVRYERDRANMTFNVTREPVQPEGQPSS
jgi:hypothetical protein